MLTIGDLVTVDQQAEFRNDVQLDAFDKSAQNLGLLRSYLFSSATPQGKTAGLRSTSSVGLLNEVVEAFLNPRLENRLVAIANYGHGKSHLALALANYFSRPFASQEAQTVLDKLGKAVNDRAQTARFRDFKESRGEFLVVRLRGDVPRGLKEQFLTGLERALSEHAATRSVEMPFWYRLAEKALLDLSAEERQRANAFLETYHSDVPQLIDQVQKRRDVYQLCVQLFTHLHNGMPPNLGGAVSLRDAVDWSARTFCTNGPLGGVLILFDEFSFYVQRFAHRATGDLQDLLNGVDLHQGKVVFLAFGQHDPLAVADFTPMQGLVRESLKHELQRLPQNQKHVLYSLMESVIDAYLNQDAEAWKTLKQDRKIDTAFFVASSIAMDCFVDRYQEKLRWSTDQFQTTVTEGCFPLHPLTTAFLCNVKLQAASDIGTPRTVLGFVLEELKARRDQPAVVDGRLNWVLPVELVDYFESRLAGEDQYRAYESARRAIGLSAPEEQQVLLKALLLQEIAGIKVKGDEQVKLVAQLAGLSKEQALAGLITLVSAKGIRYDQLGKVYLFRSADGISAGELERIIEKQLEEYPFDAAALAQMTKHLSVQPGNTSFGAIPVDIAWGDKNDWAAKEIILTREFCTNEHLRSVLQPYRYTTQGLQEDQRGAVVWLLTRDEDDVAWYRESINGVVDTAFPGDAPLPIMCVIVPEPLPELVDAFQRWRALNGLRDEDRKKIGMETFTDEREQAEQVMLETLAQLRGHETRALDWGRPVSSYAVPLAYRARINGLATPSVRTVLDECYHLAYRSCQPEFLTQYRESNSRLRSATKLTAKQLLRGSVASLRQGSGVDPVARDLCNKILYPKWHLLAPDSRVQEPGERHVRQAWDYLDQTFAPGKPETMVQEAIGTLLNTPYGYDHNTATLLFCAWFGWHAHDLSVSAQGHLVSRNNMEIWADRGPKEFLALMCETQKVALARAEPGAATRRLQQLIARTKTETFTKAQAQALRTELRDYCDDETHEAVNREAAKKAAEAVEQALEIADEYESEAEQITQVIMEERDLERLIGLHKRIERLPRLANVTTEVFPPTVLRAQVTERVAQMVDDYCGANISIQQRTQLALRQSNLDKLQMLLRRMGSLDLLKRVDEAQSQLEQRAKTLELQEQEAALAERIRSIDPKAGLKSLYGHRDQLQTWDGLSGSTGQVRDEKLAEVTGRIATLEGQADNLLAELPRVDSLTALSGWRDRTLRSQNQFDDTKYQVLLNHALIRAGQMQDCFTELARVQNTRRNTPDEARETEQQLGKLEQRYAAVLESPQKAAIAAAQGAIQEGIEQRRKEAVSQLVRLEDMFTSGMAAEQLRPKLANPPAFLPAADAPRWQKLQAQVQDKLDRQKMGQALQEQIRNMDPGARLTVLYGYQQQLRALQDLSGPTRQLRDQRLEMIAGRISKLEQQAGELSGGLDSIITSQGLDAWRSRMLRAQALYEETPFQASLAGALSQADQLAGFFTDLTQAQSAGLPHPEAGQDAERQLLRLEQSYADALSKAQRELISRARLDLLNRTQKCRQNAYDLLFELEKQLEAGTSAAQLKVKAGVVPAFLPEEDLPRWQALQAKIEALLDEEKSDQLIKGQIQAMDPSARLVVLYGYREQLQTLLPASAQTRQLCSKHLAMIEGTITKLEQDVDRLAEDLGRTNGLQALDAWRGRVHKVINRYDGTPLKGRLEQVLDQSERLRQYFAGLDRLAQGQWSTPIEVEAAEGELAQLADRYVADVSTSQQSLLATIRLSLQEYVNRQRQAAHVQLTDLLTKERSGLSPAQLKGRLEVRSAFLSDADLSEWRALQQRILERLDSDIIAQIEDKFRQIASPRQREECLMRLQKSIQESAPATATEETRHA